MKFLALLLSLSITSAAPTLEHSLLDKRGFLGALGRVVKPAVKNVDPAPKVPSAKLPSNPNSFNPPDYKADVPVKPPFSPPEPPEPPSRGAMYLPETSNPKTHGSPASQAQAVNGGSPPKVESPSKPFVPVRPKRKKTIPTNKFPKPEPLKQKLDTVYEGVSADVSAMIDPWKKAQKKYSDFLKGLDKKRATYEASNMAPELKETYMKALDRLAQKKKESVDSLHPKALMEKYSKEAEELKLQSENIKKDADLQMQQALSETTDQKVISAAAKTHQDQIQKAEELEAQVAALTVKELMAKEAVASMS